MVKIGCIEANWLYSGKVVVLGQSGSIWAKLVVMGPILLSLGKIGCIREKLLYLGKVVVFGQKWLYSDKMVVTG